MSYGRGPEYRADRASDHRSRRGRRRRSTSSSSAGSTRRTTASTAATTTSTPPAVPTTPTRPRASRPPDMFLHVKGEGLNVGCILTWGPCYDFQRQFFEPTPNKLSEPFTVLKYDIEVSGFGSQALGHVCLLNLRDQTYPGSDGHQDQGLADLDDAAHALGQGSRGPSPATPTRPTAWTSIPARPPGGCSPSSTPTRTAGSARDEAAKRRCCPSRSRPSTPTRTAS